MQLSINLKFSLLIAGNMASGRLIGAGVDQNGFNLYHGAVMTLQIRGKL